MLREPRAQRLEVTKEADTWVDAMMKESLKAVGLWGLGIGIIIGLLSGLVAGWTSNVRADEMEAMASTSATIYLALVVVLPAMLTLVSWMSTADEDDARLYSTVNGALVTLTGAGLLASLVATGTFLIIAINVMAIFGGADQAAIRPELMSQVGWDGLAIVVAVTTFSGIPIGLWRYWQARFPAQ